MKFQTQWRVLVVALLFFVLCAIIECKRGGSRRGGTYRGSSNVWGRAKQSQNTNYDLYGTGQRRAKGQASEGVPDANNKKVEVSPNNANKASAPPAPNNANTKKSSVGDSSSAFIQEEKKQQAAPVNTAQRPIGWDVGSNTKTDGNVNKQVGWNVGNSKQPQTSVGGLSNSPSTNIGSQNAYPSHAGAYPNTGANSYYGTGTNYNYGSGYQQNHPNQQFGGYNPNTGAAHSGQYYNNGPGYSPVQHGNQYGGYVGQGGYGGYGGHTGYGGYGGNNGYGGYGGHNGYGGYGGNNGYGGYGGHSGYGSSGGLGSFGGFGGNGIGGYGKRFGGGFGSGFGKHAFRNVMIGLLVWNLVSGFTRRPYYVYNYYNNPEKIPDDIPLPANLIILCPENVTSLCAPNTAALCTSNGTILCVALAQQTVPCDNNSTLKCVNSTVTCTGDNEENCDRKAISKENKNAVSTVNIPCVTNATIIGKILDNTTIAFSGTGTLLKQGNSGDTTNLCVTTFAMPQPEEEASKGVQPICQNNDPLCNATSTSLPPNVEPKVNATASVSNAEMAPLAM